jgi:hypothetical protein
MVMRMILLSALMALGIGLIGTSPTMAGPANGQAISQALAETSLVTQVPCARRRVCGRRGCVTRRVCW